MYTPGFFFQLLHETVSMPARRIHPTIANLDKRGRAPAVYARVLFPNTHIRYSRFVFASLPLHKAKECVDDVIRLPSSIRLAG